MADTDAELAKKLLEQRAKNGDGSWCICPVCSSLEQAAARLSARSEGKDGERVTGGEYGDRRLWDWALELHGDSNANGLHIYYALKEVRDARPPAPESPRQGHDQFSFKNGVRTAITWLHARANTMNDPHAKTVLDSAAFSLGQDNARNDLRHMAPGTRAGDAVPIPPESPRPAVTEEMRISYRERLSKFDNADAKRWATDMRNGDYSSFHSAMMLALEAALSLSQPERKEGGK